MSVCAFFGNDYDFMNGRKRERRPKQQVKDCIKEQIIKLIENEGVDTFFVGEIGGYEDDAYDTVLEVKEMHPEIRVVLVVSKISELHYTQPDDSFHIYHKRHCDDWIYPDKSATGYRRLTIVYRNRWIVENTDYIIAYNKYQGRAYEFCKQARNKGVQVIELTELYDFD